MRFTSGVAAGYLAPTSSDTSLPGPLPPHRRPRHHGAASWPARTRASCSTSSPSRPPDRELWMATTRCRSPPGHSAAVEHDEREKRPMTRRTESTKRPRASGESSIYQDDDGRWHGFVSMGKKENG